MAASITRTPPTGHEKKSATMLAHLLLSTLFASLALSQSSAPPTLGTFQQQTAIITIAASHGGAGSNITNRTLTIELNIPYIGPELNAVSTLYLTGGTGVPLDSLTCQAFQDEEANVLGGNPFNSTTPALLSTNTVRVGSVLCLTNYIAAAPGVANFSTSIVATATRNSSAGSAPTSSSRTRTGGAPAVTSVYVTTRSQEGEEPTQSTVTSVFVPSDSQATPTGDAGSGDEDAQTTDSATASASPGLSEENVASGKAWDAQIYGAMAVAWMGVAYVL